MALISLLMLSPFLPGNWWSCLDPKVFQGLVEVYKEVIVYLLRMQKMGISPSEHRAFNCFLSTCLKFLEILHSVSILSNTIHWEYNTKHETNMSSIEY